MWRQEGTASQRARGLAAGIFSGCFPLFGFQTILGVILSRLIKGNYLLAIAGTWISNPLTYIPIYWFNYRVGSIILGYKEITLDINFFKLNTLFYSSSNLIYRIFFGSFFVGIFFSLLVGFLSYGIFVRLDTKYKQKSKIRKNA